MLTISSCQQRIGVDNVELTSLPVHFQLQPRLQRSPERRSLLRAAQILCRRNLATRGTPASSTSRSYRFGHGTLFPSSSRRASQTRWVAPPSSLFSNSPKLIRNSYLQLDGTEFLHQIGKSSLCTASADYEDAWDDQSDPFCKVFHYNLRPGLSDQQQSDFSTNDLSSLLTTMRGDIITLVHGDDVIFRTSNSQPCRHNERIGAVD